MTGTGTRARVTSSKYSPGNMKPEALEALFVGREKTLHDVLARISASATGRGKHFLLLVGPRGVGKTHFVALLHHRLTTAPEYKAARRGLLIAYLNQEEWGVASFLDLLVRILGALAAGHPKIEARLEAVYDANEKDPLLALEVARSLLVEVVGDRTLLVLCENLVDLFEGLGEEGQRRWRAFIQEHPFWTVLATAPALFAGVQLQTSPFYGFFTERRLEKLDFETAVRLLQKKAELDGRRDLAELLGKPTGRARARAIHHLAGGNHRVCVALSEFLDRRSLDDLVTPFLRMVDDLTPYYQDRMRQLAPQQRKLVELLSRHETPAMVKEIARRCLISQQTAAKQLGELSRLGFVQSIKSGRATYYELAEPLMRICLEVRDNRTEHLRLFVHFLREWFTVEKAARTAGEPAGSGSAAPGTIAAMMAVDAAGKGPLAMAHRLAAGRSAPARPSLDELFPAALTRLLQTLLRGSLLGADGWDEAVRVLSAALADLPDCTLPLTMLAGAARYHRTRDVADLLDLPLEQRTLLLDAFPEPAKADQPEVTEPAPSSGSRRSMAPRKRATRAS